MTTKELAKTIEPALTAALTSFDWKTAEHICNQLTECIRKDPEPLPEPLAKRLLSRLRKKRQFTLMSSVAGALVSSGLNSLQIRRQYAQALIDEGNLTAPVSILRSIVEDSQGQTGEEMEARGLIGRIYKQLYINGAGDNNSKHHLANAIDQYLSAYQRDPQQYYWHGVNAVALLERAKRDHIAQAGRPESKVLAQNILDSLRLREQQATEPIPAWDVATYLEILVALINQSVSQTEVSKYLADLESKTLEYVHHECADAFEIGSTLRQLTEVWQLSDQETPGNSILPILRASLLHKKGGMLGPSPGSIRQELRAVEHAQAHLEKVFGPDKTQTLAWYTKGLKRCEAIARVERVDGKAFGTGWLVKGSDFFKQQDQRQLLLTNAHVLSAQEPDALRPNQARINFTVLGQTLEVEHIVWSSRSGDFDATFVSLKGTIPSTTALPLHPDAIEMDDPPPRMYIIGHPGGRDLEFSLQDNYLLGCTDRIVHYRSPTEPGSSGSPVFEPLDWRVLALHHAGKYQMGKIDGTAEKYEANEGISIQAIQTVTRGQA